MRNFLLIITTALAMMLSAQAQHPQSASTLKSGMEYLHQEFGVNFVYDSDLDITVAYNGKSLDDVVRASRGLSDGSLGACLDALFNDAGVEYKIMKKYIVLTRADAKKKPKDYTIFIQEQRDTLTESVITALVDPRRNTTQTGLKRIDSKTINSGFALFGTPDVIKTLQMLPGVASGTELLSGFYVHGGDGSDNLFLLDGVPIYQSSHLGGLFSAFNTDVISNMDFYKSGFPARYGSKLSSVVDITTKDGDFKEYHGLFALGLIDGRFHLEGPIWKDKTSFNIGLRRTWTETITVPLFAWINKKNAPDKGYGRYAFTDLNAKITHKFSDRSLLTANFYTGNDIFKYLDEYAGYDYYGHNTSRSVTDFKISWGNTLGSLNWNHEFNDKLSMSNKLYYTGFFSGFDYVEEDFDVDQYDMVGLSYNSKVHTIGWKSDFYHLVASGHKLRYGATAQFHIYRPDYTNFIEQRKESETFKHQPYADSLEYKTMEASVYAEDEIAVTDAFSVNAGLRYSINSTNGKFWHSVEPRLAMKYTFNNFVTAKASYTEMSQQSHLVSSLYLDLPTNMWLPSTAKIRPSRSREVAAGLYSHLSATVHLNIEGWYKHMYNLLEYAGPYSLFPPLSDWELGYKSGQGRSWGAELDFGYSNGRTEANVYYTLSWSQRKFDEFYRGWYNDRNDSRHKLTLMAKHKFGKRFEIYGAWNYHSGNRITMASHTTPDGTYMYLEPNNVKLPDYHRLDVGMNFVRNTKRGNTSIWNLSVYNAYCRTNAIMAMDSYFYVDGVYIATYGEGLGIIPIIPTFTYTLKF
jgi:hypothetical protein